MNFSVKNCIGVLFAGFALAACSPEVPKQYAPAIDISDKVSEDNAGDVVTPKVDILFVIDNSGSMQTHQNNLARNIGLFTSAFGSTTDLDFQIGVVTTDDGGQGRGSVPCCGELVGRTRIVTNNTPQRDQVLADNIMVGTDGSGTEKIFWPVMTALSERMLKGPNIGFLRADATLVTVFITDAEENGRETPQDLYKGLLKLKKGDPAKVLGYGVIIPSSENYCTRDDYQTPVKLEAYLGMVINGAGGTNIMSLCSKTYGTELAGVADSIVRQISSVMLLNQAPDISTIRVVFGTQTLPQDPKVGWGYDPKRNAIILGKDINWKSQPKGTKIQVFYKTAKVGQP